MRRLAAPGDPVALDAERAEHRAERQVERLEHGPLLDVQLQVGGRVLQLRARVERRVEVDAVLAASRPAARRRRASLQRAQLVLVRHRAGGGRRAEERAPEAGALLVGPVDEPHGQRRRALLRDPPQHLGCGDDVQAAVEPAAVRNRVDMAAEHERLLAQSPGSVHHWLPAGSTSSSRRCPRASPTSTPSRCFHVRPRDTLRTVLVAGQLAQLSQLGDGAGRGRAARAA